MLLTVAELADELLVDPGDVEMLAGLYVDEPDIWSEFGVLSELAVDDLTDVLNPGDARIELGVPFRMHDRHLCPLCGRRLRWVWVDPPTDGWDECGWDGSQWRLDNGHQLRPADEVEPTRPVKRAGVRYWMD